MAATDNMPILVVDDEESVRTVLSQVLQEDGFVVTEAANAEQALEIMETVRFALVITDIVMPGMTGIELLEKIKQLYPATQVIIMTSYASLETAITAMRYGAYDYFFKPFKDIELVSAATARAIEKVRLVEENQKLIEELNTQNKKLAKVNRVLKNLACRDGLTGIFNHRYFQDSLSAEINRSVRPEGIFSLLFLDVDHFKQYNDINGHQKGDKLLRNLAIILAKSIRKSDILARYGGEEFVIILPETSKTNALKFGEKLRRYVEKYPFPGKDSQPGNNLTISIGISSYPEDGTDRYSLIKKADQALYRAKNSGRNMVCDGSQCSVEE
jgi:diguanylate cyclase (GGDEF)-like protein